MMLHLLRGSSRLPMLAAVPSLAERFIPKFPFRLRMTGTIMINSLITLIALHRCTSDERRTYINTSVLVHAHGGWSSITGHPLVASIAELTRTYQNAGVVDFARAQRLKGVEDKKRRGKGAPPKAKDKGQSHRTARRW
ncbi:hypothetical protein EDD16DRAFT_1641115 [Pisolithus croceorrhizus]|nr:hypothetical protein EDD16DRAFT_1641115 [Pisolithus croceorrhizus]KAI6138227.1 hypothetical protein EDD17DRAFT_1674562 [Pisolithus thermaeus]